MKRGKPKSVNGKQISVYIDKENLKWLQKNVEAGKIESVSEGIRVCLAFMRFHRIFEDIGS